MTEWLDWAKRDDLSRTKGYGPFNPHTFLGVVLHVNVDEHGTSDAFFEHNPDDVCPTFEVYKSEADGGTHQYLPLNWQPWCQVAGNQTFAAIETAGLPDEPLTEYQLDAIARIVAAYVEHPILRMRAQVTNDPHQPGLGVHSMGGAAWGGHSCPGPLRSAQRTPIMARVHDLTTASANPPHLVGDPDMAAHLKFRYGSATVTCNTDLTSVKVWTGDQANADFNAWQASVRAGGSTVTAVDFSDAQAKAIALGGR